MDAYACTQKEVKNCALSTNAKIRETEEEIVLIKMKERKADCPDATLVKKCRNQCKSKCSCSSVGVKAWKCAKKEVKRCNFSKNSGSKQRELDKVLAKLDRLKKCTNKKKKSNARMNNSSSGMNNSSSGMKNSNSGRMNANPRPSPNGLLF
jgi:hypothetical protein